MGFFIRGECVATDAEADDLYYGSMSPIVLPYLDGGHSIVTFSKYTLEAGSSWTMFTRAFDVNGVNVAAGNQNAVAGGGTYPVCDPAEQFTDGVAVGWLLATALILVSCLQMLKRAAR